MSAVEQSRVEGFPSWLTYIDSLLPVTSLFIVHGNIRDLHVVPAGGAPFQRTPAAIREVLVRSGVSTVLSYSPLHGLEVQPDGRGQVQPADVEVARAALGPSADLIGTTPGMDAVAAVVPAVIRHRAAPLALIVDYLSQTAGEDGSAAHALYLALLRAADDDVLHHRPGAERAVPRNPVFVLVDRPADLPGWLLSGDAIRQVPVPVPDVAMRERAVTIALPGILAGADLGEPEREALVRRFTDATHGLTVRAIADIVKLRADLGLPPDRIDDVVRRYRVGIVDDPWGSTALRRRISGGQALLEGRVKGQPRAIRHSLDILVRSVSGMTAAHRADRGTGPRGVMFFAGPTGVGKTELAKSIAELLHGDESAYVRFDMSEFADAESDARLIGAPPGYRDHDQGGQLTNAVRERPFSVLLFDEIEKAHPRILDKFLQILSDGRLTDGSGATVFFNEALIIFTSNLGIGGVGTRSEDCEADGSAYERSVQASIRAEFTEALNRPELLGRIGDNIVVFDYISPAIAREIGALYLSNVLNRVARENAIRLTLPDVVRDQLLERVTEDLGLGARGVGNLLETAFVNPLARALFDVPRGSARQVASVSEDRRGIARVELA